MSWRSTKVQSSPLSTSVARGERGTFNFSCTSTHLNFFWTSLTLYSSGHFWLFSQFLPIFSIQWYSGYPQWGILMGKFVPTGCWVHWIEKIGRNWEKRGKMIFHALFMDMDLSWPQTCSHWPKMVVLVPPVRYFNRQVCFYRFLGPLGTKYWKKLRKK